MLRKKSGVIAGIGQSAREGVIILVGSEKDSVLQSGIRDKVPTEVRFTPPIILLGFSSDCLFRSSNSIPGGLTISLVTLAQSAHCGTVWLWKTDSLQQ